MVFVRLSVRLAKLLIGLGYTFLVACSSNPVKLDGDRLGQIPDSHIISNLPYFPQEDDQCGPASLATVLGARNIAVTPQALREKVYIPAKQGSLKTEMVAQARRHGMLVYRLDPQLTDIFTEVSGGNPVLVLQNLGFDWLPRWHFSVVIGYDISQQIVTLRSGKHRAYNVSLPLFSKTWNRADNWAVVIMDPSTLPQTAQQSRFLSSANELEIVGEAKAALAAYTASIERWPASSLTYFGAGNTAYSLDQFDKARQFFSTYIKQNPKSPAGWNNLAFSLIKLGCRDEALSAISCALNLAPGEQEYLSSKAEILSYKGQSTQTSSCPIPRCPLANRPFANRPLANRPLVNRPLANRPLANR